MEPYAEVVEQYHAFAGHTHGESPCFEEWSLGVAGDPEVAAWVARLPGLKKQPNLVFAAARWHGVPAPGPYAGLRAALLADDDSGGEIRATIMSRSTQTNEVARLATLLPALDRIAGGRPLALIEAGASAGLNLYPDRWGYAWSTPDGGLELGPAPRLDCEVTGPAPLPDVLPRVAWRGGVDLNPLDVTDPDQMRWLKTLVWPEEEERRIRLRHAIRVAQADPPRLVRGDLLERLPALVAQASAETGAGTNTGTGTGTGTDTGAAVVVVFHSAVVAYLTDADRARFQTLMTGLVTDGACHWVSNEGPRVLPEITATAAVTMPERLRDRGFVLGVDGRAVAVTHGHGQFLHWLAPMAG